MFMATTGKHAGKYVAKCATDSCGYDVVLEDLYKGDAVIVRQYPKRRESNDLLSYLN